jgi:surface protein
VATMWRMLNSTSDFNGDLSTTAFNGDVSSWLVSFTVITMRYMFYYAPSFNGDVSSWDVSFVLEMSRMYSEAYSFNDYLSSWDVSNVKDMSNMFSMYYGVSSFNFVYVGIRQMLTKKASFSQVMGIGWTFRILDASPLQGLPESRPLAHLVRRHMAQPGSLLGVLAPSRVII